MSWAAKHSPLWDMRRRERLRNLIRWLGMGLGIGMLAFGILAGCTNELEQVAGSQKAPPPPLPVSAVMVGDLNTKDTYSAIYTFTVDGTRCIAVGRYSAWGLSCDWK